MKYDLDRHDVVPSARINRTENLIRSLLPSSVLELGAGDHSFRSFDSDAVWWCAADFAPPCDVLCDFGAQYAKLPFKDASFDLVACTQVLEHMLWPHNVLTEIYRVLRPGGYLVASVPNIASITYRFAWLIGRIPSCAASANLPPEFGSTTYRYEDGSLVGGHVVDFNYSRFARLLDYCGFTLMKMEGCGIFWHRQIIPHWLLPVSLSSDLIALARKPQPR